MLVVVVVVVVAVQRQTHTYMVVEPVEPGALQVQAVIMAVVVAEITIIVVHV